MAADRRREAARETMRRRWADPATAERMRANLKRGARKVLGDPPDPPPPPVDPAPPPPADPPRRHPLRGILEGTPADLVDRLRRRE